MKKQQTKKEKAPPAKFWPAVVKLFFDFIGEKIPGERPTFDGPAPRDLKSIMLALEQRAERANVSWTEETACLRLKNFLDAAWNDPWLQKNFLLSNLNRQKDKIFYNAKRKSDGAAYFGSNEKPVARIQSEADYGSL